MRLTKPGWVHHDGKPIFSIDIHPDGSRFATGGQGDDTGKVVIWNTAPVRNETDEKDKNVPKIICQMDNHIACVNCVRWSNNGKYLASGGDDKLIMIWQIRYSGSTSTMFGSDTKNQEQWRPSITLRGHSGDILDLAWSGNDSWLASCSVDNSVVVWNADKFPEQLAVLRGHSGLVKGVTWDPVGKYLASQADDKSVRIWRTRDWQEEKSITKPFQECGGTTHVLRLNWSPDGAYIVSAHAMNNSGPTAQIIERDGWKATLDFVGHRKAITAVRFNPNIFASRIKGTEQHPQYTCCAIGSKDRSLSVWLTALKRPLVVTKDLFDSAILDITWSKNGMELMACSHDGTVAFIDFTQAEIGTPLTKNDVQMFLEKIYGKCLPMNKASNPANQIIESAAMLKLHQQQKIQQQMQRTPEKMDATKSLSDSFSNDSRLTNGGTPGTPFKPTEKQIETKTKDGRRRITPIFLAPQPDVNVGDVPLPFSAKSNQSGDIMFETTKEASKIVVEKQDIITGPGFISPQSKSSLSLSLSSPPQTGIQTGTPTVSTPKMGQPEKKSSTSESDTSYTSKVFLSPSIQPMSALVSKSESTVKEKQKDKEKEKIEKPKSSLNTPDRSDKEKVKDKLKLAGIKRKHDGGHGKARAKKEKPAPLVHMPPPPVEKETIRLVAASSDLKLSIPTTQKTFNKVITGKPGADDVITLEVENDIKTGVNSLHKIKSVCNGTLLWEQVFTSRILAVTGTKFLTCTACEDSSIHIFSNTGRKVLPSLVLNSPVSRLTSCRQYLMAITQKGNLFVWNVQKSTAVIRNESLMTVMSGDDHIVRAFVTADGAPTVSISTHKSYTYSSDLGCWIILYDKQDVIHHSSDHHSCTPPVLVDKPGPLASLASSSNRLGMQGGRIFSVDQSLQQVTTINHLESQMAASLSLQSGSEYKFWLQTYVRYLAKEGLETKIREVCDDLLGPVYKSKGSSSWDSYILGMKKRELLHGILPNIGSNLQLQRLFTEYQEQLETIEK